MDLSRARLPSGLLLAAALLLAACGDDSTAVVTGSGPEPAAPSSTTSATTTSEPIDQGPGDDIDAQALVDLQAAQDRWITRGPVDYSYRYQRSCECDEVTRGPLQVTVAGGEVVAVEDPLGQPVERPADTIGGLFERIEAAILAGQEVAVTYDEADGHPLSIALDLEALARDGGFALDVLDLDPVGVDPGDDALARELAAAEARWAAAGVGAYELTYQLRCFCPETVVTATVVDGAVTEAQVSEGGFEDRARTVEDLFGELRSAIEGGAHRIEVIYHPELGHPVDYWIDEDQRMADEEHGVTVRSLTPTG